MTGELRQFQRVRATIRSRECDPDGARSSRLRMLEGQQLDLFVAWKQGDLDSHPGEYALVPMVASMDAMKAAGLTWLSSGDLQIDHVQ
jgi:hypothetical protein